MTSDHEFYIFSDVSLEFWLAFSVVKRKYMRENTASKFIVIFYGVFFLNFTNFQVFAFALFFVFYNNILNWLIVSFGL